MDRSPTQPNLTRTLALVGCQVAALAWFAHVLLAAALVVFRAIKNAGIAGAFQFDDVPLLKHFDEHFPEYYNGLFASGIVVPALLIAGFWWRLDLGIPFQKGWIASLTKARRAGLGCALALALFEFCVLTACFPLNDAESNVLIQPIGLLDWGAVAALALWTWQVPPAIIGVVPHLSAVRRDEAVDPPTSAIVRNCGFYLLACAAVVLYAVKDHLTFWDQESNGNYNYKPFFAEGELPQADLVLYSTSILFASLAALAGCVVIGLFRWTLRSPGETSPGSRGRDDGRWFAVLSALTWAGALCIPWQIKIWPEIAAERGWILPAVSLAFAAGGLVPLLQISWAAMTEDFTRRPEPGRWTLPAVRRSEMAVWNFVLFPFYPAMSLLRALGPVFLTIFVTLCSGAAIVKLTLLVNQIESLYDFDDWRGMLRSGLFPFLRVAFAVVCACFAYIVLRRLLLVFGAVMQRVWKRPAGTVQRSATFGMKAALLLLAGVNLGLATWPFWGWKNVNENVFTRLGEFSHRHEFELRFLHWLFDFDRDGYSALLHGADPDDFDAAIQPGYIPRPIDENPVPIDEFAIVDEQKAKTLPNVVLLYLEGVTCESIGAYGRRRVDGTPHMDSIAKEGTIFTQARCYYPSTWDAWYSTLSGRYLRIQEMDTSRGFGDRYCRYSNLYKVLKLAGFNRWCHSNTEPYYDMLVPYDMRGLFGGAWQTKFDSSVSAEEQEQGVWRGDKRNQRILTFLDSIKPNQRFFVTEHMSDTHFPWKEVPGKEWASDDAVLHDGRTDQAYSNYFQTIARMDEQIGAIVQKLKERRLYDNTIVVIVSDHGCQWWEHEHMYYVSHLYDPSLRVPLIVRIPPRLIGTEIERVVDEPVMQTDVLPTIMELAGIVHANPREDYPMECRSLVPLMTGTADGDRRRAFWERDVPLTTHYDKLGVLSQFRYKLIFNRPLGTYKLFDLREDPRERVNLVDSRPELLQEMLDKLREQLRRNPAVIGGIERGEHQPQ